MRDVKPLPPYTEARPGYRKIQIMDMGGDPMTKTQAEIVTSVRQRRRWSRAEKERIVAAAMEPGAVASAVAREAGIQASQLFRWRRQLHGAARFASLTLEVPTDAGPITAVPVATGVIEVAFRTGARLRICGPVDAPIVAAVMQALTDCGKR
jgi:transposase